MQYIHKIISIVWGCSSVMSNVLQGNKGYINDTGALLQLPLCLWSNFYPFYVLKGFIVRSLTYWGLAIPYDDIDLGQHWLR